MNNTKNNFNTALTRNFVDVYEAAHGDCFHE